MNIKEFRLSDLLKFNKADVLDSNTFHEIGSVKGFSMLHEV